MEVHNLMEDVAMRCLNEILELKTDICKCSQCRLDMLCYVLNKTKPMYVVSSRGIIHSENEKRESRQNDIDVYALVKEAIDVVSRTPRHKDDIMETEKSYISSLADEKAMFVIPAIVGRVLDAEMLDPVDGIEVFLYYGNGETPVAMFNKRWNNPVTLLPQMDGTFTFWPEPVTAEKNAIQKEFQMNIEIKRNGATILRKFFELTLVSSDKTGEIKLGDHFYRLDDIYINRED